MYLWCDIGDHVRVDEKHVSSGALCLAEHRPADLTRLLLNVVIKSLTTLRASGRSCFFALLACLFYAPPPLTTPLYPPNPYAQWSSRHSEEVVGEPSIQEFIGGALLPAALDSMASSSSSSGDEFDDFAATSFTEDIVRGGLRGFVSSSLGQRGETDATVRGVLTFMPGMRTAMSVSGEDFHLSSTGRISLIVGLLPCLPP